MTTPASPSTAPLRPLSPQTLFLLENLPLTRKTSIVDVGANPINPPDYLALLQAGHCQIIGFEPQEAAFARLQATKGENETYFPYAVGDGSTIELNLCRHEGMTSGFVPDLASISLVSAPRLASVLSKVQLDTMALDRIPDLPAFDFLKIDIQGGELAVFKAARRVMSNALAVMVEMRWHRLYEGEPMSGGIDQELRAQGFALHKFVFNKSWRLKTSQSARLKPRALQDQLIDGDAVYIRDLTTLSYWRDDQCVHLALLAASVLHSHSLVLHLLDELHRRGLISADIAGAYVDTLPDQLKA